VTVRPRHAIIDIGSNSVRLVVYDGPARAPIIVFNEKIMAGLGRDIQTTGMIDPAAAATALTTLVRYRALVDEMGVETIRTVATAAVRDALNGAEFAAQIKATGLELELLSGDAEAVASGYGVISADPDADGIVGDLGGGSLELIQVSKGTISAQASFPLGVLRLAALREEDPNELDRQIRKYMRKSGFSDVGKGLPFYLVGGSWRSLARLDMKMTGWPLPILQGYKMALTAPDDIARRLEDEPEIVITGMEAVSGSRRPMVADSARLLAILVEQVEPSELVVSSYGLREGLLYQALDSQTRQEDPLIAATRAVAQQQGRFPEHGDLLFRWLTPLFGGEKNGSLRLHHAACLLADVGWVANPDFRAERGFQTALYGNWVGVDAAGRAFMAQAVFTSFGGRGTPNLVSRLISPEQIKLATRLGFAMRLGQRLSGGTARPLAQSSLTFDGDQMVLQLEPTTAVLANEVVERRFKQLASAFGCKGVIRTEPVTERP
jgi:exopolyphosphatase / guanosine-5'-triphosphate,3'-diphosphate pyrophosphatase